MGTRIPKYPEPDWAALAEQWHYILSFTENRVGIFEEHTGELLDRTGGGANYRDRLPHPGFVGSKYRQAGLLFLGLNPAHGPIEPGGTEEPHYAALQTLRQAGPEQRDEAFRSLMANDRPWMPGIRLMRTVIQPALTDLGLDFDDIAYLNVVKWRTQNVSNVPVALLHISLQHHTLAQINSLAPKVIAVLGIGLHRRLVRFNQQGYFPDAILQKCVCVPRTNGDRWLSPEGRAGIDEVVRRFQTY